MAGKTIPGVGEDPPLDPADAADSGASGGDYYSGPTVVDDAKVEMGLQKLRSLDQPPGPLTGITKAVVDALESGAESERTRVRVEGTPIIPEITVDSGRETAVGRGVVGPVTGQQTTSQPFDDRHLRGTMFGHGVHLPEIEMPPRTAAPVPVSRALAVIERGAPTNHEVAIFHQPPPRRSNGETLYGNSAYGEAAHSTAAHGNSASLRNSRFENTPYDVPIPEPSPGKKIVTRIATAAVGIAAIVGAAMIWVRTNSDDEPIIRQPPAVRLPPVQAARPVAPPPDLPAAPAAPAARPAAPPTETAVPTAKEAAPPAAAALPGADDGDSTTAPAPPSRHAHSSGSHSEHRHAARTPEGQASTEEAAPKAEKADKPEKPARAGKKANEEDPDATMAPSIE